MFDLFCFGGISLDLVLKVPRLPVADEKMLAEFAGREPGGLVANAACAASNLGLKVGWGGQIGDDDFGRVLMNSFKEFGVDTQFSIISHSTISDFCIILLDPGGERTILVVPTQNDPLLLSPELLSHLSQARIGYTIPHNPDWFKKFAGAIHSGGGKVAIDLEASSPVRGADLIKVLQQTDIVFCNWDGLKLAVENNDLESNAKQILELGVRLVVVTQGKNGAAAFSKNEAIHINAYPVPVVDSTGAGDCFHAAYIVGLLENWDKKHCLTFASAAAAISVQSMGARGGLPNRVQVNSFLKTHLTTQV